MKKIFILILFFISSCASSDLKYVEKEVIKVESNVSPSIGKLAGEASAGLLFLAFDIHGYLNFNLNQKEIILHTDATLLALNYGKNGESFSWYSDKRMSSGKTKIIATYYRNDVYCRIIQSLINLNGGSKHKTYNLCLVNNNWIYS